MPNSIDDLNKWLAGQPGLFGTTSLAAPSDDRPHNVSDLNKWLANVSIQSGPASADPVASTASTFRQSLNNPINADMATSIGLSVPDAAPPEKGSIMGRLLSGEALSDPSKPWYSRLWSIADTPLVNLNAIDPENTALSFLGSVGKGAESGLKTFFTGLTEPWQLALMAGTLGGDVLWETGATAALKAGGLDAGEIAVMKKGASVVANAAAKGVDPVKVLAASGIDMGVWQRGVQAIAREGLAPAHAEGAAKALLSKQGIITGLGSSVLRGMNVGIKSADTVTKTIQSLVNLGFSGNMLMGLAQEAPAFLDAAKEGDVEKAANLAVQIGAGSYFTWGGFKALKRDAGEGYDAASEKLNFKLRPQYAWQKLRDSFLAEFQQDVATSHHDAQTFRSDNLNKFKKLSPIQLEGVKNLVEAGFDPAVKDNDEWRQRLGYRHDLLAENAGRPDRIGGTSPDDDKEQDDRYHELAGEQRLKNSRNYDNKELDSLLESYKVAAEPTQQMQDLAGIVQRAFSKVGTEAHAGGVVGQLIDYYTTNMWGKDLDRPEDPNEAVNELKHRAGQGDFHTNVSMARQRTFANAFEGQMLGRKLSVTNPIELVGNQIARVGEAIATRAAVARLRDLHTSTGQPVVVPSGTGKVLKGAGGGPVIAVDPSQMRGIPINERNAAWLKRTGQWDRDRKLEKIIPIGRGEEEPTVLNQTEEAAAAPANTGNQEVRDLANAYNETNGRPAFPENEPVPGVDENPELLQTASGGQIPAPQPQKDLEAMQKAGFRIENVNPKEPPPATGSLYNSISWLHPGLQKYVVMDPQQNQMHETAARAAHPDIADTGDLFQQMFRDGWIRIREQRNGRNTLMYDVDRLTPSTIKAVQDDLLGRIGRSVYDGSGVVVQENRRFNYANFTIADLANNNLSLYDTLKKSFESQSPIAKAPEAAAQLTPNEKLAVSDVVTRNADPDQMTPEESAAYSKFYDNQKLGPVGQKFRQDLQDQMHATPAQSDAALIFATALAQSQHMTLDDFISRRVEGVGKNVDAANLQARLQNLKDSYKAAKLTPQQEHDVRGNLNSAGLMMGQALKLGLNSPWSIQHLPDIEEEIRAAEKTTGIVFNQTEPGWYYSALARATERLPKSGTAEQMLNTLKNTPGVKADELKWTGLDDFLKEHSEAGKSLTRKEINDFLQDNQVQVEDVTRSANGRPGARYEERTEPGPKENYREVLLTLPVRGAPQVVDAGDGTYEIVKDGEVLGYAQQQPDGGLEGHGNFFNLTQNSFPDAAALTKWVKQGFDSEQVFRGGHWDEPNVLAHVRLDDRTDASGKRTLFVEEVQSDWHQKGKKEGYVSSVPEAPFAGNWHELAMKRILALAAEGGYDKVAWTTGDQQKDRYNLKFGGEWASRLYDEMIPQFLAKYGKKWGVKVGETELESRYAPTEKGQTKLPHIPVKVHSIDITPEMKKSVSQGQPLFQGEPKGDIKGTTTFLKNGKAIMSATEKGDFSTIIHEFAHTFKDDILSDQTDRDAVEKHLGVKNGIWTREHHEQFARELESYFREGRAPIPELQGVFARIASWMRNIYTKVRDLPTVSDEVRNTLDKKFQSLTTPENEGVPQAPKRPETGQTLNQTAEPDPEQKYMWNPDEYLDIDHPAFRGWNWAVNTPEGVPVMVEGRLKVHPEAYNFVSRAVGAEKSSLQANPIIKGMLGAGSIAKHTLLSLSPFHIPQIGLRAIMSGVLPRVIKWDLHDDPELARGVRNGLTIASRYGIKDYQEGLVGNGGLVSKIPKVRNVQNWLQELTFEKILPSLKVLTYRKLYARNFEQFKDEDFRQKFISQHPDFGGLNLQDTAARASALETNERLGNLNYRDMGRAAGAQDFLRLTTLAPDWLESEVRMVKRMFDPTGGRLLRRDMLYMTAGMWAVSRILNLMFTGKAHNEAPFGVVSTDDQGREKVYSIRTLPTDMLHMASDPVGFMKGRMSPIVRSGTTALTGRDQLGRQMTGWQTAIDLTRNLTPIPVQAIGKAVTGEIPSDVGNVGQFVKAAGATVTMYRTQAQKEAATLASEKSETGPVDPSALRRHQARMELTDQLRSGQATRQDLYQAVETGSMPAEEAQQIINEATETKGMDADIANLYIRASRLPMVDFLKVWDLAGADEQMALTRLMLKKKNTFFKNALKTMTPQERQADPTYQRLRRLFPAQAPW